MSNFSGVNAESKPDLFGGLALLPYVAVFLLAALGNALGWLQGTVPYLGTLVAFFVYRFIQNEYYNRRYTYAFDKPPMEGDEALRPRNLLTEIAAVVVLLLLLAAWYVDSLRFLPVHFSILLASLFLIFRAVSYARQSWHVLSCGYLVAGGVGVVYALSPLILRSPVFAGGSVFDLLVVAAAVLVIALVEHHTIMEMVTTGPGKFQIEG